MKKKYKLRRILITLVSLCAVFSLFCIPVSAASSGWTVTTSELTNVLILHDTHDGDLPYFGTSSGNNVEWSVSYAGETNQIIAARMGWTVFSVSNGDQVTIEPISGGLGGWSAPKVSRYRWAVISLRTDLPDVDIPEYDYLPDYYCGYSQWYSPSSGGTGSSVYNVSWPKVSFDITLASNRCFLALEFDLVGYGTFSMNSKTITFGYGNPNSPEAPNYILPSDGSIDELGDIENDIFADINSYTDQFNDMLNGSFSWIGSYMTSLNSVVQIMGVFIDRNGALRKLINISLVLGVVSFLLNIVNLVADRLSFHDRSSRAKSKGGD